METKVFNKEEIADYAKGNTKESGKVTLLSGKYLVSRLEKRSEDIGGDTRKWMDVHVVGLNVNKSGSFSGSRMANAGFEKTPVKGQTKGKWYFPTKGIKAVYEGDLADLLVDIQGKVITIEVVNGFTPKFALSSWDTKEAAETAAKTGWAEKQFIRIVKIESAKAE